MKKIKLEEIIIGCQKQKTSSQEQLYKLFYEQMLRVCMNYTSSSDLVKDFLQDGFIKVFQNIKKYEFQGSFEGWIKRVFINNILDELKKNNVLNNSSNEDVGNLLSNSSLNNAEANLEVENILKVMSLLPNKTKLAFTLFVIDGYSHKEISEQLNISTETSQWHVKEARTFFKERYSTLRV